MRLLNTLGFIAFLYAGMSTAFAHPMTETECRDFSTDAIRVAYARDAGVTEDEVATAFIKSLDTKVIIDYVRDQIDAKMVLKMIGEAFYPAHQPLIYGARVYNKCVQHIADKEV